MGVSTNTESRSRGAYQIIQGHTALLAKIVNADGPVRRKQYDGKMGKLQHEGIIERVDRVVDDSGDNTHRYYRWRIASRYREMVEAVVDSQAHLPCGQGHTGWRCVEAGKEYVCTECGAEYERSVIEQLEAKR